MITCDRPEVKTHSFQSKDLMTVLFCVSGQEEARSVRQRGDCEKSAGLSDPTQQPGFRDHQRTNGGRVHRQRARGMCALCRQEQEFRLLFC